VAGRAKSFEKQDGAGISAVFLKTDELKRPRLNGGDRRGTELN